MIKILTRAIAAGGRTYRFHNPNHNLINRPIDTKTGKSLSPEEAAKQAISDSSKMHKGDSEPFFDTKPGEMQWAPNWIQHDEMFNWAMKDKDLTVIPKEVQVPGFDEQEPENKDEDEDEDKDEDKKAKESKSEDKNEDKTESSKKENKAEGEKDEKKAPAGATRKKIIG